MLRIKLIEMGFKMNKTWIQLQLFDFQKKELINQKKNRNLVFKNNKRVSNKILSELLYK